MQLTKYTHACVRLSSATALLVIDPGVFSEVEQALADVDAVLLTHQHPDHVDADRLAAAARANPALRIWAPADAVAQLSGNEALADRLTTVGTGETFSAGGFDIRTFGGQHAVIHPRIPVIANVAYLVDEAVYHPGDSFTQPNATVQVALVPTHAPWSKSSEVVDYVTAVRAPRAFQIHDSLLQPVAQDMVEGLVSGFGSEFGTEFSHLTPGQTVDV